MMGSVLGADIIALILFACFGNWLDRTGVKLAFTAFSLLLLWWMVYSAAWNEGFRDPNRVRYGHIHTFMPKGLMAGLIAEAPLAVLTLVFTVDLAAHWNNDWIRLIYFICHIPYVFVINHFQTAIWVLWAVVLAVPAFATVGYILGYRQIELFGRLVYKKKKPAKASKR